MKKVLVLLILCLICSLPGNAQQPAYIDSLQQLLRQQPDDTTKVRTLALLFNAYLYNDPAEAIGYAQKELALARKINHAYSIGNALYLIGVYFGNQNSIDSARIYYNRALDQFREINRYNQQITVQHALAILEYDLGNYEKAIDLCNENLEAYRTEVNDTVGMAMTHHLLSSIYTFKGSLKLALQESLTGIRLLENQDAAIRMADALNQLGSVEASLENYEQAIEHNRQALKIYRDMGDISYASQAMNDIGNCFYYLDEYDSALHYLDQAFERASQVNSLAIKGTVLNNMGKTYARKKDFNRAISLLEEALQVVTRINYLNKQAEVLNDMAGAYNNMGQPFEAIARTQKAIAIADSTQTRGNLKNAYLHRSNAYEQLNNHARALANFKQYKAQSDSIFSKEKSNQIAELRTIYETGQKEKEIALQKAEISLLEEQATVTALQRTLFGAGLLVALVVIGFGYYAYRQKLKNNLLEKEKLDTELAFKRKELTSHALHLAHKNEVLEALKRKAHELQTQVDNNNSNGYRQIIRTINADLNDDNNWENFRKYFEEVHQDFNSKVKEQYPDLTPNELRLMALMKMNLTSKEIANILNISQEGIKKARYRLRKKLQIPSEESLQDLMVQL